MAGDVSEKFVTAVELIYSAAAQPAEWPKALEAIAHCSDDVGAILIYQRDDGSFGITASEGLAEANEDYGRNGWWREDIRFSRYVERSYTVPTEGVTERHVVSRRETEEHPFYALPGS